MELIESSAKTLWIKTLQHILDHGIDFKDKRGRVCREIRSCVLTLTSFQDFKMPVETLITSSKWKYPSLKEIESIMLDSNIGKNYIYSYGERLFQFGQKGINQIDDFVIPLLKKDPETRRAFVSLWDPQRDSALTKLTTPGLTSINFQIRENALHVTAVVRSNDIFIGWPANIYQLYAISRFVSEKIGVPLGSITSYSISAHIFKENFDDIKKIIEKYS